MTPLQPLSATGGGYACCAHTYEKYTLLSKARSSFICGSMSNVTSTCGHRHTMLLENVVHQSSHREEAPSTRDVTIVTRTSHALLSEYSSSLPSRHPLVYFRMVRDTGLLRTLANLKFDSVESRVRVLGVTHMALSRRLHR